MPTYLFDLTMYQHIINFKLNGLNQINKKKSNIKKNLELPHVH